MKGGRGGWGGGGGERPIAFLLHQFRVTRFGDAGSDILIGFALTSTPEPNSGLHAQFCSATWPVTHTEVPLCFGMCVFARKKAESDRPARAHPHIQKR